MFVDPEKRVEYALFHWLATDAEDDDGARKAFEDAMLIRSEEDEENFKTLLDVWAPSDVLLECVVATVSFLEEADVEETKVWFVDVETSARFNLGVLKSVSDLIFWEAVLLDFATLLGDDRRLLSFGDSQVEAEPLEISIFAVTSALRLLVESPKELELLSKNPLLVPGF